MREVRRGRVGGNPNDRRQEDVQRNVSADREACWQEEGTGLEWPGTRLDRGGWKLIEASRREAGPGWPGAFVLQKGSTARAHSGPVPFRIRLTPRYRL